MFWFTAAWNEVWNLLYLWRQWRKPIAPLLRRSCDYLGFISSFRSCPFLASARKFCLLEDVVVWLKMHWTQCRVLRWLPFSTFCFDEINPFLSKFFTVVIQPLSTRLIKPNFHFFRRLVASGRESPKKGMVCTNMPLEGSATLLQFAATHLSDIL